MIRQVLIDSELYGQLQPLVEKLGFDIVEISESINGGKLTVRLVIQNRQGNTSIDDCARVHRLILPRLEVLRSSRDLYVEVSTPGIQRTIKDTHEFTIFTGRRVQLYLQDSIVVLEGQICEADTSSVSIETTEGVQSIPLAEIKKAKIVYNWEGKN